MPIFGIMASSISGSKVVTGSYESIATVTVGSGGASSVEFTSIASTWTHLQIRAIARDNYNGATTYATIALNSDTGSTYSWHDVYGTGAATGAEDGSGASTFGIFSYNGNTATANIFQPFILDILDYANTNKYKTGRYLNGTDVNGSGNIYFGSANWRNTAAITSIKFTPRSSASFAQYSHFALYGVKA